MKRPFNHLDALSRIAVESISLGDLVTDVIGIKVFIITWLLGCVCLSCYVLLTNRGLLVCSHSYWHRVVSVCDCVRYAERPFGNSDLDLPSLQFVLRFYANRLIQMDSSPWYHRFSIWRFSSWFTCTKQIRQSLVLFLLSLILDVVFIVTLLFQRCHFSIFWSCYFIFHIRNVYCLKMLYLERPHKYRKTVDISHSFWNNKNIIPRLSK